MAEAKLTPLAKVLIAVIIVGATAAAAWHLGLKGMFAGDGDVTADGGGGGTGGGSGGGTGGGGTGGGTGGGGGSGALGSAGNPLKVSIVSFHGYAPALL